MRKGTAVCSGGVDTGGGELRAFSPALSMRARPRAGMGSNCFRSAEQYINVTQFVQQLSKLQIALLPAGN